MSSISKEKILANVSAYDILSHYLQPYCNNGNLTAGKHISNPFISEKQQTPSFNIFQAQPNHDWRYKDFATGDEGSCFDLVMNLFKVSFPEALEIICRDFHISNNQNLTISNQMAHNATKPEFSVKKRQFKLAELAFFQKYGITEEILQKFNVVALEEFSSISKDGKPYNVKSSNEKFIFAYDNGQWLKLYKPLDEKRYKFQFLGIKEQSFKFGWKQLPEKGNMVFITGGEKDVLTLASHGFNAFSLNSETATLDKKIVDELQLRFNHFVVLYDNDNTGLKQSEVLSNTHGLHRIILPPLPNNGKDISDFFATGAKVEEFNQLLSASLQTPSQVIETHDRVVYNAVELMAMGNLDPKYLIAPIFPQKGTAVIAGKPDTGKSQFARQLCIQVALGINDFIGFQITPTHNRSIYVATEDNLEATCFLLNKQLTGLDETAKENLRFIFADTMDQEEILIELDKQLKEIPADLVVVDSFGDIFKGGDSNNNMAMRNTVKTFDKIAKQHNCLIVFVHHINKGAYRQMPGQEHIQGGAGLMQKVRLGIQLSEGDNNTRYFTVVKGNYCPKEHKQNSLILNFSEETFLFTHTGKSIPTSELGTQPDTGKQEEKYSELQNIAQEIFGDKLVSFSNFVKAYCDITGKSVPTAKRVHGNLKKLEIIVACNGSYRLANTGTDEFSETLSVDEAEPLPF